MLRYRVLLIDNEAIQERPVQAFCNTVAQVEDWAKKALARASKDAWVVVYRVNEIEVGTIKKSDYDKGAVRGLQPAGEETSEPAA